MTKLDPSGSSLVYSTFLNYAVGSSIAVDPNGNAYVGGVAAADFITTSGAYQPTSHSNGISATTGGTGFVAKVNSTGSALLYATFLGGSGTLTNNSFGATRFQALPWMPQAKRM